MCAWLSVCESIMFRHMEKKRGTVAFEIGQHKLRHLIVYAHTNTFINVKLRQYAECRNYLYKTTT